jgi:exonuclease SbcD
MMRILHFADAHIDMAAHGRHDPQTGLPLRVLDFLKALDSVVNTAVSEKVDMVIFAGDAYRDRTPAPTFQREWGRRIMRLSQAGIPTLLLVGNHDLSPAVGRAHALQEYDTLQVPHVVVVGRPSFLRPANLDGLPLQVMALPWVSRSSLMASLEMSAADPANVYELLEERLAELMNGWFEQVDPNLPLVLTAHASVEGAKYGQERSVMLGADLVLPGGLVRNPRFDYVAMGHIHKAQNINEGNHPPVVYSGSIERVDFGEAADDKCFVIAHVERGHTEVEWRKLSGRKYIDRFIRLEDGVEVNARLVSALPEQAELADAMLRLKVEYPRTLDTLIDEAALRRYAAGAFEFHLLRRPQVEARARLPENASVNSMTPAELLELYWLTLKVEPAEVDELQKLAAGITGNTSDSNA